MENAMAALPCTGAGPCCPERASHQSLCHRCCEQRSWRALNGWLCCQVNNASPRVEHGLKHSSAY